jgi:hypothetical protein
VLYCDVWSSCTSTVFVEFESDSFCHNRTLCELVRRLPRTLADLHRVWGIGPKRIVQHGELMLDALEPFRTALAKQHPAKLKDTQAVAASAPAVLDMEADCIPQPKSGQMTSKSVVATAWQEDVAYKTRALNLQPTRGNSSGMLCNCRATTGLDVGVTAAKHVLVTAGR